MTRRLLALILGLSLLMAGWSARTIHAGARDMRVRLGMPAIWTLEQAHYLLARQRRTNLDLQAKALSPEDLNPNATNVNRLNALRQLFGAEVGFDESLGLQNADGTSRRADQRSELTSVVARIEDLRSQQVTLTRDIGALRVDIARLDPDTQKVDVAVKQAEISTRQAELELVTKRLDEAVTLRNTTATSLNAPLTQKTTTLSLADKLPESAVSSTVAKALEGGRAQLHASAMLDNYIQMQYELIAKQLSLLKEDVGVGKRLVFLELPLSVYSSPKARDVLVETKWTVDGYYRCKRDDEKELTVASEASAEYAQVCGSPTDTKTSRTPVSRADVERWVSLSSQDPEAIEFARSVDVKAQTLFDNAKGAVTPSQARVQAYRQVATTRKTFNPLNPVSEDSARAVDLFPRQAALNVNAVHDSVRKFNFSGFLSLVSGFGARTQFERQKELFENYIQQDVFASAFGKGTTVFGWTFGPLPGSRQVEPGLKTTYAALVVPAETKALRLLGSACPFERRALPSANDACDQRSFFVVLPTDTEGYQIDRISYTPVEATDVATLILEGAYFSPQIGALVDGVPLRSRSMGLAQTELDGSLVRGMDKAFRGEFEYVNSKKIVLRITAAPHFEGTPRIMLITPQRAGEINADRASINGTGDDTLRDADARGAGLFQPAMSVSGVKWIAPRLNDGMGLYELSGPGLGPTTTVEVNGASATVIRATRGTVRAAVRARADTQLNFAVSRTGTTAPLAVTTIENPLLIKKVSGEVVAAVPVAGTRKEALILKLSGGPFDDRLDTLAVQGGELLSDSVSVTPTEISFSVRAPTDTVTVTLRRAIGDLNQQRHVIVDRQKGSPAKWVVR